MENVAEMEPGDKKLKNTWFLRDLTEPLLAL